jgi:tRNA threonylcarbamoyladenosine biosynthesis protein TsaE
MVPSGESPSETPWVLFDQASTTLDELASLADRLARALRPGDLVLLQGPLGAGKTALVRFVARALGVTDPVRSPSFTLANVYAGPVPVNHLDLYRLDDIGEMDSLALEEYLDSPAVTLVEWPSAGRGKMQEPAFFVELDHDTVDTRRVRVLTRREEARERWEAVA